MKLPKVKLEKRKDGTFKYWEGERFGIVFPVTTLTKAEVRLFCYSIATKKSMCVSPEKEEQFEEIFKTGKIPTLFGFLTRRRKGFCIQEENGKYQVYLEMDKEEGISKVIQKILEKVKD